MNNPSVSASFRDPTGAVLVLEGRVLRAVTAAGMEALGAFLATRTAARWSGTGALVPTSVLGEAATRELLAQPGLAEVCHAIGAQTLLEHEAISFPSFPYEWPAEMLHAAAHLTLDLALDLLPDGFGLKDATPYNVLFRGASPVFVDVLSIERRAPGDATWLAYAQFIRTFLLPLAAHWHLGLPLDQLLFTRRDGIEPEEFYRWLGPIDRLRPAFLSLVSIPVWLGSRRAPDDQSLYRPKLLPDPEKAGFILRHTLDGLARKLDAPAPTPDPSSTWTGYMEGGHNYTPEHFQAKERFVADVLAEFAPRRVIDVGSNTGHFSLLAARAGASVVAIDSDPAAVGRLWRQAHAERCDVLPLVVNLVRPTPGMGWRNREWPSFLDRACGAFDAVLMLAVVHHMLVTERVPLAHIIDLAAELTTDLLVIEFVSPEDSMFRRLLRGRDDLFRGCDAVWFERECCRRFDILRVHHLEGTARWLYALRRKRA